MTVSLTRAAEKDLKGLSPAARTRAPEHSRLLGDCTMIRWQDTPYREASGVFAPWNFPPLKELTVQLTLSTNKHVWSFLSDLMKAFTNLRKGEPEPDVS